MKTLASHPGAGVFRSTLVIIIILLCIISFFTFTARLGQRVEEIAKEQVIIEVKQALAMMLYDFAIKGRLSELSKFNEDNPFVPLAIYRDLPKNYFGTIGSETEIKHSGWYFDIAHRTAVYRYSGHRIEDNRYKMTLEFEDLNEDGVYDTGDVGYLAINKSDTEGQYQTY